MILRHLFSYSFRLLGLILFFHSLPALANQPDYKQCWNQYFGSEGEEHEYCIPGVADPLNAAERQVYDGYKSETHWWQFNQSRVGLVELLLDIRANPQTTCKDQTSMNYLALQCEIKNSAGQTVSTKSYPWLMTLTLNKYLDDNMITPEEEINAMYPPGSYQADNNSTQGGTTGSGSSSGSSTHTSFQNQTVRANSQTGFTSSSSGSGSSTNSNSSYSNYMANIQYNSPSRSASAVFVDDAPVLEGPQNSGDNITEYVPVAGSK